MAALGRPPIERGEPLSLKDLQKIYFPTSAPSAMTVSMA